MGSNFVTRPAGGYTGVCASSPPVPGRRKASKRERGESPPRARESQSDGVLTLLVGYHVSQFLLRTSSPSLHFRGGAKRVARERERESPAQAERKKSARERERSRLLEDLVGAEIVRRFTRIGANQGPLPMHHPCIRRGPKKQGPIEVLRLYCFEKKGRRRSSNASISHRDVQTGRPCCEGEERPSQFLSPAAEKQIKKMLKSELR